MCKVREVNLAPFQVFSRMEILQIEKTVERRTMDAQTSLTSKSLTFFYFFAFCTKDNR